MYTRMELRSTCITVHAIGGRATNVQDLAIYWLIRVASNGTGSGKGNGTGTLGHNGS